MKKIAILQSNYIPWKGYFDMIAAVDEFIIYDDRQFTKNDWRNRNQIKTPQGIQWLTIPVKTKGRFGQTIRETEINGDAWREQHLNTISQYYKKARFFNEVSAQLQEVYSVNFKTISDLNVTFIKLICNYLGISTKIKNSWDFSLVDGRGERLVDLCQQSGATVYISGPAAKNYIEPSIFKNAGIDLNWFDYDNYPEYPQLWGEFRHGVSILDLLFNCGKESPNYMKYVRK
jgi:hypothetical protein